MRWRRKSGFSAWRTTFSKKNIGKYTVEISRDEPLSIKRQAELLGISRSSFYYEPKKKSEEDARFEELIKARLDYWHTMYCFMGVRRLRAMIRKEDGISIGRKLIKRCMEEMNIHAVGPKPNLSKPGKNHEKAPYLLRNKNIFMANQVWAIDITYIKMGRRHMYLTVIIDWHSRFIVGWELSDTLETANVLAAVQNAMAKYGVPGIINSDQGSQFTSKAYMDLLKEHGVRQSMDGKGRWVDNVIIERWFRSLKTECTYINEYSTPKSLRSGIKEYVQMYNFSRPHSELGMDYPAEVYFGLGHEAVSQVA